MTKLWNWKKKRKKKAETPGPAVPSHRAPPPQMVARCIVLTSGNEEHLVRAGGGGDWDRDTITNCLALLCCFWHGPCISLQGLAGRTLLPATFFQSPPPKNQRVSSSALLLLLWVCCSCWGVYRLIVISTLSWAENGLFTDIFWFYLTCPSGKEPWEDVWKLEAHLKKIKKEGGWNLLWKWLKADKSDLLFVGRSGTRLPIGATLDALMGGVSLNYVWGQSGAEESP